MTDNRSDASVTSTPPTPVPLDPTGVAGLDEVLGGGIQRGSLAIIAGPPGSGKTILAHQIAFAAARTGRHTTILTAFSEPTNKLIAHMRPFSFFDDSLLGQTLDVLSIQPFLRQGLGAATDEVVNVVRATKAELVVLDGFRGVRETSENPDDARRFIYDVSNRLSLLGVTLLLTSEANSRDTDFFLEATTADVLLGLSFDAIDARERRSLEVIKVRGAAPLAGQHALSIGDEGVTIYPRLEASVARRANVNRSLGSAHLRSAHTTPPAPPDVSDPPISSGIPGLDPLLEGGFVRGASTLIVGERGTGKTLFGLQYVLRGARAGEPAIFVSFRETADQMLRKAAAFQWAGDLRQALQSGTLTILRRPPIELQADLLAANLFTLLDETAAQRLVLDEVGELERALAASGYPRRFHDFMAALVEALRLRGVTPLLTNQLAEDRRAALEQRLGAAGALSQNLLWLRQTPHEQTLSRSLVVLQTALSYRSGAWHTLTIQPPEGVAVRELAPLDAGYNGDAPQQWAESVVLNENEDTRHAER